MADGASTVTYGLDSTDMTVLVLVVVALVIAAGRVRR